MSRLALALDLLAITEVSDRILESDFCNALPTFIAHSDAVAKVDGAALFDTYAHDQASFLSGMLSGCLEVGKDEAFPILNVDVVVQIEEISRHSI